MSALTTTMTMMIKEPTLLLTNFLVPPCRREEFKNSKLTGNREIEFYDKDNIQTNL